MTTEPYFRGASGRRHTYAEIADRLRREAAHTLGEHISVQLAALGLLGEMEGGTTPCGLPFTFADAPAPKPYSVLLLYPDYIGDYGSETYYAFVEAADPLAAVAVAQRQAAEAQAVDVDDPADFAPLLVIAGHHAGEPLFNK